MGTLPKVISQQKVNLRCGVTTHTGMTTACEHFAPKRGCQKCGPRPLKPPPPPDNGCRCDGSFPVDCCCPLLPYQTRPPEQRCDKIRTQLLTDESLTPNVAPMTQWITVGYHLQPPNQTRKDYVSPLVKKRQPKKRDFELVPKPGHTGGMIVECARIMGRTKPITCFIPKFTDQPPYYVGAKRGVIEGPEFFVSRAEKGPEAVFPFPQRECFQAPEDLPRGPPHDAQSGKRQHVTGTGSDRPENTLSPSKRAVNEAPHQSNGDWPPCDREKPSWYLGSQRNPKRPVDKSYDYDIGELRHDKMPITHIKDVELDEVKKYIPGEVVTAAKKTSPKPVPLTKAEKSHLCADSRPSTPHGFPAILPRGKTKVPRIHPPEETYMIDPWIGSDEQFSRVGGFYKAAVIKALNDKYPSPKSPFKPRKFGSVY